MIAPLRHLARAGMEVDALPTPCLVADLDRVDANLDRMAALARAHGVALRPHVKTHKCLAIWERQRARGAIGITAAKLSEAQPFVEAGVDSILITYPVTNEEKVRWLLELGERVRVVLGLPGGEESELVGAAAARLGGRVEVVLDLDPGGGLLGAAPAEVPARVRRLARQPGLRLVGVMTYPGRAWATRTPAEREEVAAAERAAVAVGLAALAEAGVAAEIVSVGSTPSAPLSAAIPGATELRPGTYVFQELQSVALGTATEAECALSLLTAVIARPRPGVAIVDAGSKALSNDRYVAWGRPGFGLVPTYPHTTLTWLAEECGVLEWPADLPGPRVGERLRVIPNHACGAVAQHDWLVLERGGRVESVEPIIARGLVW